MKMILVRRRKRKRKKLSMNTQKKVRPLQKKVRTLRKKVRSLRKKVRTLQNKVRTLRKKVRTLQQKKRRLEADAPTSDTTYCDKSKDKSIDDLIEDELKEMGDRNKRHFVSLDSGCNGCIFIQMHKSAGDPGPASIVQHMNSAASTRKHMSRFILRVVPAEVTCYTSEEEISKAIKPLIEQHFPTEAPCPQKVGFFPADLLFSYLYKETCYFFYVTRNCLMYIDCWRAFFVKQI
ncbi:THUMP domain-containing protein 1-like protein isoform X1 [Iris pallida]|uniref:THUMP domain-containing protein 1-like protein isoform X1 n=1 Tax=Iris pallida TaxID=29817 RepID=A0AAX6ELY2_IRIPA|nr:THUMP domain-containing protein 1-like protein isoform X1 [Iris pallida]